MNRVAAVVALLAGATIGGLFVGAHGPLRSFVGDIVVVVFLVAGLAAVGLGGTRSRLLAVGGFAVAVEAFQGLGWVVPRAHWALDLTVGSTADPWDLVAYALGLGVAAGLERLYRR
ncbi:MAG: DUF2809 domain-containing protein [Myxococcota bacterium]